MTNNYRWHYPALPALVLLWLASAAVADDTIYARTGNDGAVSLSNVPATRGYLPLVGNPTSDRRVSAGKSMHLGFWPSAKAKFDGLVARTADAVGIDSALLHAVISVESGYDPVARSPKGAAGLMQLMPATARRYGVVDARDPAQNLQGGAQYLRDLLKQYDSDLSLTLAAYNAGENAVARFGNRVPPFSETLDYVPKVLAYYRKYRGGSDAQE